VPEDLKADQDAHRSPTADDWFAEILGSPDTRAILKILDDPAVRQRFGALASLRTLFPPEKQPERADSDVERRVPFEVVQLDYMQTGEQIKMLTDIRFKLLAFVPPIVLGGVALLSSKSWSTGAMVSPVPLYGIGDQILTLGIGLLGFVLTLGVVLYDVRNSQLYNSNVHRAKVLEGVLRCVGSGTEVMWPTPSVGGGKAYMQDLSRAGGTTGAASDRTYHPYGRSESGGVHTQRAVALGSILGLGISHGSALSLVYSVALGAWLFPIVRSIGVCAGLILQNIRPSLTITYGSGLATSGGALLVAIAAAIYFWSRLKAQDSGRPAVFLGYADPKKAPWREQYEDVVADDKFKRFIKARKLHRFSVTRKHEYGRGVRSLLLRRCFGIRQFRIWEIKEGKFKQTNLLANLANGIADLKTKLDLRWLSRLLLTENATDKEATIWSTDGARDKLVAGYRSQLMIEPAPSPAADQASSETSASHKDCVESVVTVL
jgi:hypothetical protein